MQQITHCPSCQKHIEPGDWQQMMCGRCHTEFKFPSQRAAWVIIGLYIGLIGVFVLLFGFLWVALTTTPIR